MRGCVHNRIKSYEWLLLHSENFIVKPHNRFLFITPFCSIAHIIELNSSSFRIRLHWYKPTQFWFIYNCGVATSVSSGGSINSRRNFLSSRSAIIWCAHETEESVVKVQGTTCDTTISTLLIRNVQILTCYSFFTHAVEWSNPHNE